MQSAAADGGRTVVRADADSTVVRAEGDANSTVVRAGADAESTVVRSHPDATPTMLSGGAAAAASEEGPVTPEVEGRYEVRSEYGRGGQSRVLLAFDAHMGREIALKELLPDGAESGSSSSSTAAASRFVREARITGQLEHPNIVPVYELGRHADGSFYYTQKLVRGTTLKKKLAEARTLPERLKLLSHFSDICHAVAYAHSRGVIHRDLKTENVMVGQFGETVVLDWGLAKARGEKDAKAKQIARESELMRSADATLHGHALGTPSYMSPEQAQGKLEEIDERSDVWSLGAILFETLTGRPPFQGESAYSVIGKVIHDPPPRVRGVLRDVPPELAAVADKCLSRERSQRYASAEEVAREVEAYLTGGNVRAYQYSSWELLRRFVQRHRALTAVSGLALLLLLAALVVIHDESVRAKSALAEAKHNLAQAYLEKAHSAERDFFWHKADVFYAAARVQEDGPQARWGSVVEGEDASGVTRIAGPEGWVVTASFSPDGKTIAAAGMDSTARVFDIESGRELWRFTAPAPIKNVAFSPDGRAVATRDISGLVRLHARDTGALLGTLDCKSSSKASVAFSAGRLVAACPEGGTRFLDLKSGAAGTLPFDSSRVVDCGGKLLYADETGVRLEDGTTIPVPSGPKREIACGGGLLAASGADREIHLFDVHGRPLGVLAGHGERVTHIAISPDGKRVASGSIDGTVRLWEAQPPRELALLQRPSPPVWVEFSPDGQQIAVGEQQNALLIWDLSREKPGRSGKFLFLPGGGYVFGGSQGVIKLFGADDKPAGSLAGEGLVVSLALGPSDMLAAVRAGGAVEVWDLRTRKLRNTLHTEPAAQAVLVLPDGALLLRTANGALELRDPATGRQLRALPPAGGPIDGWLATPDGKLLLLQVAGRLLRIDLRSGAALAPSTMPASALALSADGSTLAVGASGRVTLVDPPTLARKGELKMEGAAPLSLAFSPDASLLAASGEDGAAHLYELGGGGEVAHLPIAGSTNVTSLQFSADGRLLHLRAEGSAAMLGGARFLRIGDPTSLPLPEEALQKVLESHGAVLTEGEVEPRPPPVNAVSGPAPAR